MPEGLVKINTDVVFYLSNIVSLGMVTGDQRGMVQAAARQHPGKRNLRVAESKVVLNGLKIVAQFGYMKVILINRSRKLFIFLFFGDFDLIIYDILHSRVIFDMLF